MVKLTMDLIGRGTSGYARKKKDETLQQFLRRLTHLYLENKNITEVVIIFIINLFPLKRNMLTIGFFIK